MNRSRARLRHGLRSGAITALLAAAGLALACGSGTDGVQADTPEASASIEPSIAAAPPPPEEPVADPVEAMVEIARREGENERGVAITRCMMEQVQEFNGRDAAVSIVRAKRAQLANQPLPSGSMPALGIMAQEAEDCAAQYDAAHADASKQDAG